MCSSLVTWSKSWRHTSLLCKRAVHGRGRNWWWFLLEPKHVGATVGILVVLIFLWICICVRHVGIMKSALIRSSCPYRSHYLALLCDDYFKYVGQIISNCHIGDDEHFGIGLRGFQYLCRFSNRPVVPNVWSGDPQGCTTSSQGICGYIYLEGTLKCSVF